MDTEKTFRTKTGYCHVTQESIILTRDRIIGNVAKVTMGNNIARPLIIYAILAVVLFVIAYRSFSEGQWLSGNISLIVGFLLLVNVYKGFSNSATPIIDRHKIKDIEFKNAISGATRSYFIIYFQNDKGEMKRRLIMLPGTLAGGQKETEKALEIMKSEFGRIKNVSF